jgi:hypothetical protein
VTRATPTSSVAAAVPPSPNAPTAWQPHEDFFFSVFSGDGALVGSSLKRPIFSAVVFERQRPYSLHTVVWGQDLSGAHCCVTTKRLPASPRAAPPLNDPTCMHRPTGRHTSLGLHCPSF